VLHFISFNGSFLLVYPIQTIFFINIFFRLRIFFSLFGIPLVKILFYGEGVQ
jgi:hypothetical protein